MKKLLSTLFLLLFLNGYSQTIKLSIGGLYSSLDMPVEVYDTKITTMPFLLGLDYLEHKNFMLSTEVGYLRIGGKETIENLTQYPSSFESKLKFDFLHLNTTIRYRLMLQNNFNIYAGLGPKLDLLLNSGEFSDYPYSEFYKMPSTFIGLKTEIGAFYDFNKLRIGFNGTYFFNANRKVDHIKYNYKAYGFLMSVGYKL